MSVAIIATAAVALASAMSTGSLGYRLVQRDVTAARLAVAQMENTKADPSYLVPPASYPTITAPAGYGLTVQATALAGRDSNTISLVTVTVTRDGATVKVLEDFKAKREIGDND